MATQRKRQSAAAKPARGKAAKRTPRKKEPSAARKPTARKPTARKPAARTPARGKPAASKASGAMFQKIAFTLFHVADPQRARAFYEEVLGLTRGLAAPNGVWTEYDLPGGGCLALFCHPLESERKPGGGSVAFEVADLDALNQRLSTSGVIYQGDMVHGPRCRMSNILDSEGNAIILHELTSPKGD